MKQPIFLSVFKIFFINVIKNYFKGHPCKEHGLTRCSVFGACAICVRMRRLL